MHSTSSIRTRMILFLLRTKPAGAITRVYLRSTFGGEYLVDLVQSVVTTDLSWVRRDAKKSSRVADRIKGRSPSKKETSSAMPPVDLPPRYPTPQTMFERPRAGEHVLIGCGW